MLKGLIPLTCITIPPQATIKATFKNPYLKYMYIPNIDPVS